LKNQKKLSLNKKLTEQSEELQLSDDLRNANENLIIKDRQKDDFLDSVAHELRTPITAIRSAGEILADDDIPLEIKEFLNNIITESDRLVRSSTIFCIWTNCSMEKLFCISRKITLLKRTKKQLILLCILFSRKIFISVKSIF
jgi:light-regulated signal transduction histidine kinase (bacteriophytochrome)